MGFEDDIHSLPQSWSSTTLGELCDASGGDIQTGPFGSQLHSSDYVEVGVPSIMPTNISVEGISSEGIARITTEDAQRLQRYRVKVGDIVYSRRGDVEKCALVTSDEDGWLCGTGCLRVRMGHGPLSPDFLHAYLSSPPVRAWVVRHAVGATMPNLNTGILRSVPLAIPPSEEMAGIGDLWAVIRTRMNNLVVTNQTLEAIARAIFKSWFVDFDPVRAKAEGREPEGMDVVTGALFADEFGESELGSIPRGWHVVPFDKAMTITSGGTPKTSRPDFWDGAIPWFSIADAPIESEVFVIQTEKTISEDGLNSCAARLLPVGATIISARGTVGKLAITGVEMAINQSCYALLPSLLGSFATFFQTARLIDVLRQRSHGAVFSTITRDTLASVSVVVPPLQIAEQFELEAGPLMQRILNNRQTARTLGELRDTLLPRLISGKLRVPEAQKLVEAVL
jgi:restriction endonuclease S subunit